MNGFKNRHKGISYYGRYSQATFWRRKNAHLTTQIRSKCQFTLIIGIPFITNRNLKHNAILNEALVQTRGCSAPRHLSQSPADPTGPGDLRRLLQAAASLGTWGIEVSPRNNLWRIEKIISGSCPWSPTTREETPSGPLSMWTEWVHPCQGSMLPLPDYPMKSNRELG